MRVGIFGREQDELSAEEVAGIKAINDGVWKCGKQGAPIIREVRDDDNGPNQRRCLSFRRGRCTLDESSCNPTISRYYIVPKDEMDYVNGVPITELQRRTSRNS